MFEKRINKLRKTLEEKELDGLLVTNFYNIFYLTGFKTLTETEREAWMLITAKNNYVFSDSRYLNVKTQMSNIKIKLITQNKKFIQHLQEIVEKEKISRLGFEGENLKYAEYLQLKNYLGKVELIATDRLIIRQRAVKDKLEILKIKKACEISDQCLSSIIRIIKPGTTEKEIARNLERWLKEKGYDLSFYPIVAIDTNSAIPHYDTKAGNNSCVKRDSIILIDFGVKYQDYCSDISRVFFMGKPKTEIANIYNALLSAQVKTLKYLTMSRSYHSYKEVDEYCRSLITNYRLPIYPHSTGHGVGLEIHEYPKLSSVSQDVLEPNQVFTVEPGVYMRGKWGMRIEDTVAINEKFNINILTKFSKKIFKF